MRRIRTRLRRAPASDPAFSLDTGSRVAVVGGGPAGSLFSYFLLSMAERVGIELRVDIYEPKNFSTPGPAGCNMCGGIVSESMVQLLSTEGIKLPPTVVQRGIDSYILHMDVGTVRIDTPRREKRIAAVHRGAGPLGVVDKKWASFDGYLLDLAAGLGAGIVRERVLEVDRCDGKPRVRTKGGWSEAYDLLVGAVGINSAILKTFENLAAGYKAPKPAKTFICEFFLGQDVVQSYLGNSMHVFLLPMARLEFAALIPKGDYVTVCLLGKNIDKELVDAFLRAPEVRRCFPPRWSVPETFCRCSPAINVQGSAQPFADRMLFLGDSGVNRLYKDGIGGAYRTAKAAAKAAVFHGVSEADFRAYYLPTCRSLARDNMVGAVVFLVTRVIKSLGFARTGLLRLTAKEQRSGKGRRRMSSVLWDTFTGSATYKAVFVRTLNPLFLGHFIYEILAGLLKYDIRWRLRKGDKMSIGGLGKVYRPGEIIVRQGETGDCMFVVQSGRVEVVREKDGQEIRLAELGEGEFFGEMALFEKDVRSATVRPIGEVRVLSVDRKTFLRKIHDDPSLVFVIMRKVSRRLRDMNDQLARMSVDKSLSA